MIVSVLEEPIAEAPTPIIAGRVIFSDRQVQDIIRFLRLCETMSVDRAWQKVMVPKARAESGNQGREVV
jgi:hypothetical protein